MIRSRSLQNEAAQTGCWIIHFNTEHISLCSSYGIKKEKSPFFLSRKAKWTINKDSVFWRDDTCKIENVCPCDALMLLRDFKINQFGRIIRNVGLNSWCIASFQLWLSDSTLASRLIESAGKCHLIWDALFFKEVQTPNRINPTTKEKIERNTECVIQQKSLKKERIWYSLIYSLKFICWSSNSKYDGI